jgi:FUS-interacting serine-arginine-rich protein 1
MVKKSREVLERKFEEFGKIKDIYIPLDYHTKEPRGFAYVEFQDESDAVRAYRKYDHIEINGVRCRVEFAKGMRKSTVTPLLLCFSFACAHSILSPPFPRVF